MDGSRFDNVSRLFAQRRLSRRVLAQGGAGLAAGALAASPLNSASAQDATPPVADVEKIDFLFVQSFQSGSIAPIAGDVETYTLTLEQGLGQTIYFSDRPERIVGATPSQDFLDGLGFSDENPPNAALLIEPAPGETDIAVLELFNPRYDQDTHTATYDVQLLKDYEQEIGLSFAEQPKELSELHSVFGAAHLFIDGCPDSYVSCWDVSESTTVGQFDGVPFCYWVLDGCVPCAGDGIGVDATFEYWGQHCNDVFPDCGGNCAPFWG